MNAQWEKIVDTKSEAATHRLRVPGGWLVREQFWAINPVEDVACSFAVALVFVPDPNNEWAAPGQSQVEAITPPNGQGDHIAQTMLDLVTPKQLIAIRAIANAKRLNAEAESLARYHCVPAELSKKTASRFIDWLGSRERNVPTVTPPPVAMVEPIVDDDVPF